MCISRVEHDRRVGPLAQNVLDQLQRAVLAEPDVEQRHVEPAPLQHGASLLRAAGDTSDPKTGLAQQQLNAPPHHEVILNDDYLEL